MQIVPEREILPALLDLLSSCADAVAQDLDGLGDWGLAGTKPGQYKHDLVADEAVLRILGPSGMTIVSEESGVHEAQGTGGVEKLPSSGIDGVAANEIAAQSGGDYAGLTVVVDPVDGSTNASHGIPWWATSLCVLDGLGPLVSLVVNQANGDRYVGVRGEPSTKNGREIKPSGSTELSHSIVALNGYPTEHLGWAQFRALGAAALEICAVADGSLDAFVDATWGSLAPWDYLGAMLVCQGVGAPMADSAGKDLVTVEHGQRRAPLATASEELFVEIASRLRSYRDRS